jgi:hypothetical protein
MLHSSNAVRWALGVVVLVVAVQAASPASTWPPQRARWPRRCWARWRRRPARGG